MKHPEPQESPTFCVMPWANLATETNGKCKICCIVMSNRYIKDEKGEDYLIQRDPIEKIWNSRYLKEVRQKMLRGERVSDCFYCYAQEDAGSGSPRQNYNQNWYDASMKKIVDESKKSSGQVPALPVSLEPRPGILCNLKCNMCWSMSSSKIYAERKAAVEGLVQNVPDFLKKNWKYEVEAAAQSDFNWSESGIYERNFDQCLPSLKRLYFTGGEPILIKSNYRFVEKLLRAGQTDTLISFTTNLHRFDPNWIELLSHFSRVEITGSVDGLFEVNDYIRFPSKWSKVHENLDYLYNQFPKIQFSLMYVVQAMNVLNLPDLLDWIAQNYPERQIQVIPTILQGPRHLSLGILTKKLRDQAVEKIEASIRMNRSTETNHMHLRNVLGHLKEEAPDATTLRSQFRQYISYLDYHRDNKFDAIFPELKELLNPPATELK